MLRTDVSGRNCSCFEFVEQCMEVRGLTGKSQALIRLFRNKRARMIYSSVVINDFSLQHKATVASGREPWVL